jgi:hypothetical protein
MSVFLTVLSVIAAVTGGLIALVIIVFLCLLPIKAEIDTGYNKDDGFFLRAKYFLFSFTLFPPTSKDKKEKKKEEPPSSDENGSEEESEEDKSAKETEEKRSRKENVIVRKARSMGISDYITLISYVKDMLGKIRFGDLCINIIAGSDDASKTAVIYGALTAAIFPLIGRIHNEKKAKYIDAHINADFGTEKTFTDIYAEVYIRTIHAVALAFKTLIYILRIKENNNGRK